MSDTGSKAKRPSQDKLLYLETPTNPTLKVMDIARLAEAGHAVGAVVVVDNTFATPINTLPLELGADLVVHSATKFLGGHADALGIPESLIRYSVGIEGASDLIADLSQALEYTQSKGAK